MSPSCIEICAGCGGASRGLHDAGFDHRILIERDPIAAASLRLNEIGPVLCQDLNDTDLTDRTADLVWASPPCQPYSRGGLKRGAQDPRDLWSATLSAIRQIDPRWVVIENVIGCPADEWRADLLGSGFTHCEHKTLNAADYGVPQLRRRVFIVAGYVPFCWPIATHKKPEINNHIPMFPDNRDPWASIRDTLNISRSCPMYHYPSPAIGTSDGQGIGGIGGRDRLERQIGKRALSVDECRLLQGFPDTHVITGNKRDQYRQIGNAVPPIMARLIGQSIIQGMK